MDKMTDQRNRLDILSDKLQFLADVMPLVGDSDFQLSDHGYEGMGRILDGPAEEVHAISEALSHVKREDIYQVTRGEADRSSGCRSEDVGSHPGMDKPGAGARGNGESRRQS